MRRSAALAALATLAGCTLRRGTAPIVGTPRGRPVHIIVLGDSLALGTGASAPKNGFLFRAYLRVLAVHPGSRIDDYAIAGATARDVLRLEAPRLARARADAVVVCVGGNDVVRRVDASQFAATYAALMARVRVLQPHAARVCCGLPDVGLSPLFTGSDHDAVTRLSRENDAAVRAVAQREGAVFVDLFAATVHAKDRASRYLSDDRFHPSDAGHAALADAVTPGLLRALSR
jgi:lysophospholipase L1-like esterase